MTNPTPEAVAVDLAREFHDTYERLAPQFGYETRPDTRAFDPESPNGKLMTAVVAAFAARLAAPSTTGVQLAHTRAGRIYVAGPMTGLPEFNFPAFNEAAAKLRSEGWHVENPAEYGIVDGATWADYMHYDMGRIASCEAVYLLPGWEASKGATLEGHVARALGMRFLGARLAAPVAQQESEHVAEIRATLEGAHRIMEKVSSLGRRVGPVGLHARGYTHKITNALKHLDALASSPPAAPKDTTP